jgi:hypothetical protein
MPLDGRIEARTSHSRRPPRVVARLSGRTVEQLTVDQLTLGGTVQEQLTLEKLGVRSVVRQVESISPQVRRGPLAQLAEQLTLNQLSSMATRLTEGREVYAPAVVHGSCQRDPAPETPNQQL